jgi:hypothetical protein
MQTAVPAIYSPRVERVTVGLLGRLLSLAISVACGTVMVIATRLIPSPTGMGTHTQLGFEPCYFALQTGIPCPSCGMTTSYSWLARGNFPASFYVQPMGAVLGLATIVTFWAGLYVAVTGRSIYRLIRLGPTRYYVPSIVILAVAAWAWKIFIHLHGIDGWR